MWDLEWDQARFFKTELIQRIWLMIPAWQGCFFKLALICVYKMPSMVLAFIKHSINKVYILRTCD